MAEDRSLSRFHLQLCVSVLLDGPVILCQAHYHEPCPELGKDDAPDLQHIVSYRG